MNHPEIHGERQAGTFNEPQLGDILEESSWKHLVLRLYGSNRLVVPAMVYLCGDGTKNAEDRPHGCNEISNR